MIEGSCDCGSVQLRLAAAPERITDCNCSICRRLGALWAYYHPSDVTIAGATVAYSRGERLLAFHHCGTCGCTTHWSSLDPARQDRMGVNTRLFDPSVRTAAKLRRLDGADSWTYVDED